VTTAPHQPTWKNVVRHAPAAILIFAVRIYQWTLSPLMGVFGVECRFQPTCSRYFVGAVQKYGAARGAWRGIKRLCRCHPFGGSGYDPP
jgi:putative membrane protein insertion efficiency factor